jgi:hypothetical protein
MSRPNHEFSPGFAEIADGQPAVGGTESASGTIARQMLRCDQPTDPAGNFRLAPLRTLGK